LTVPRLKVAPTAAVSAICKFLIGGKKGSKEMQQVAGLETANMQFAPNARSSLRLRPLPQLLIANPRLEFSTNNGKQTNLRISNRERIALSARNLGAIAMSASLQVAECWHQISMATRFRQQQRASFHGDRCAGGSDLGMLNAELGKTGKLPRKPGQDCKKGEIEWKITKIPPAKRRMDRRKVEVELQLQRA
jgi:hypothetical protein